MLIAATAVLVAAGCSPPPKLHRVTIRSFRFEPATLTVAPGDTVQWDNQDVVPHTATSGQVFDSASIAAGGSWRWVATGKDSLAYQCTYHVNMKAALIVR